MERGEGGLGVIEALNEGRRVLLVRIVLFVALLAVHFVDQGGVCLLLPLHAGILVRGTNLKNVAGIQDWSNLLTIRRNEEVRCRVRMEQFAVLNSDNSVLIAHPVVPPVGDTSSNVFGALLAQNQAKGTGGTLDTKLGRGMAGLDVVIPAFLSTFAFLSYADAEQTEGRWDVDGTVADETDQLRCNTVGGTSLFAPGHSTLHNSRADDNLTPPLNVAQHCLAQKGQIEDPPARGQHFKYKFNAGTWQMIERDDATPVLGGNVRVRIETTALLFAVANSVGLVLPQERFQIAIGQGRRIDVTKVVVAVFGRGRGIVVVIGVIVTFMVGILVVAVLGGGSVITLPEGVAGRCRRWLVLLLASASQCRRGRRAASIGIVGGVLVSQHRVVLRRSVGGSYSAAGEPTCCHSFGREK
mmetsp:Transcript_36555/g.79612  ORF Transcript_36555/g.79612 Transcript_36555/m.79612 type:complete len:412 (-) Transcript_36555:1039-2274(-)